MSNRMIIDFIENDESFEIVSNVHIKFTYPDYSIADFNILYSKADVSKLGSKSILLDCLVDKICEENLKQIDKENIIILSSQLQKWIDLLADNIELKSKFRIIFSNEEPR